MTCLLRTAQHDEVWPDLGEGGKHRLVGNVARRKQQRGLQALGHAKS